MTQPEQPATPQDQDNTLLVLGTVAAALALIAIESRVRDDVETAIHDALVTFTALLVTALATPLVLVSTGIAFMSRDDVHRGLVKLGQATRDQVKTIVQSGYTAGVSVAQQKATRDLAAYRYQVPIALPALGDNLTRLLTDVDLMFGHAQTNLQNTLIGAYDTTSDTTLRAQKIRDAVQTAGARVTQRALASATVAVHTGAYDAQQAIYNDFQLHTGRPNLMKRWRVTSLDPCGMCRALDGTLVGLNGEFDARATTDDKDLRPVWRNNQGPPRHPNCRCTIELVQT